MSRSINGKLLGRAARYTVFDEFSSPAPLSERDELASRVEISRIVIKSIDKLKFPEFESKMQERLIENEKALADYDALNAVTDAQDTERAMYDFTPTPSDMLVDFDFDAVQEIPFGEGF